MNKLCSESCYQTFLLFLIQLVLCETYSIGSLLDHNLLYLASRFALQFSYLIVSSSSIMTNRDLLPSGYTFKFVSFFISLIAFFSPIVKLFSCFFCTSLCQSPTNTLQQSFCFSEVLIILQLQHSNVCCLNDVDVWPLSVVCWKKFGA